MDHLPEQENPLLTLIDLAHRARAAGGAAELAFLLVNDSKRLFGYRQSALWFEGQGVHTLSGVLQADHDAPYVQWLEQLCAALCAADSDGSIMLPSPEQLPQALAAEWSEWLPEYLLWLPLTLKRPDGRESHGGLLLAADQPFPDYVTPLLKEWGEVWRHAWQALHKPPPLSLKQLRHKLQQWYRRHAGGPWWQQRPWQIALALCVVLLFPVQLTVTAPGELVAANPDVLRAPLDGVIGQFHVSPNQAVKKGQLLFSFDEAPLLSRLEVAQQTLATAETEYRQLAQMALSDPKYKTQLAALIGKISEKQTEAAYLQSQLERSRVTAPQNGIAIIDDPSEWIGRPVQTGERVMKVAREHDVEIEAWLPVGDAIALDPGSTVKLYLAADPFSAAQGRIRYQSHDAVSRPDGSFAYRVRASLEKSDGHRIGLKGTTKLYGAWVTFGYWVFRRPVASIRQYLAV